MQCIDAQRRGPEARRAYRMLRMGRLPARAPVGALRGGDVVAAH